MGPLAGWPLSPNLFILVAEALSMMICGSLQRHSLYGFCRCPLISHLFFANGSPFCLQANKSKCAEFEEGFGVILSCVWAGYELLKFFSFSNNASSRIWDSLCAFLNINQWNSRCITCACHLCGEGPSVVRCQLCDIAFEVN